jgi:predicted RND superfamily exporter protein
MCISVDDSLFLPALAVAAALILSVGFAVRRFIRGAREANNVRAWSELMEEQGPALFVNGLWLFIGYLAARSCGVAP